MPRSRSPKVGSVSSLAIIITRRCQPKPCLGAQLGDQAHDLGSLERIIGQ